MQAELHHFTNCSSPGIGEESFLPIGVDLWGRLANFKAGEVSDEYGTFSAEILVW